MGDNLNLKLAEAYRAVAREMSALADILDQNEDTATDIKSLQKKRKRASDPNKPKAPLSAYLIYSNEKRDDVKNSMGLKADVREVMRVLASQWNGLEEAEKEPYIELARADKERFRAAMDEYNKVIQANGGAETDGAAPAKGTPTKAVPTKATPTKAVPTKATPTKATLTKATPTKATPTKAVKTKDTPKAQPTTLTESSSDKSDDSGSESEDSSSSESEDDSSSSDEEVPSKQPVKPKVAPAVTAEKPKGSPKKAAIVDNTPKPTADIKSKAKVTKKEGQGDKQKSFKKAADKSGPLKKKFKKSV